MADNIKKKRIGIKDIAEYAGVSLGPVDKVINRRGGVAKGTEKKILDAIEELGYTRNIFASRLKSPKNFRIAVLLPIETDEIPYWKNHSLGLKEIQKEIEPLGTAVMNFRFDQNDAASFELKLKEISKLKVEAVFLVPVFPGIAKKYMQDFRERGMNILCFDTELPDLMDMPFIGQNAFDSGCLAAEVIAKYLHDSDEALVVSLSKSDDNHYQFDTRIKGFETYLKNSNVKLTEYKNDISKRKKIGADLKKIFSSNPKIKAVFVANGIHVIGETIKSQGRNILIGYDLIDRNIELLKNDKIDFIISQQPYQQSYLGVKSLFKALTLQDKLIKRHYLPIDLISKSNLKYYKT